MAVCAVSALAVSCTQKVEDYKAAEPVSGPQVYFSNENTSSKALSATATSFKVIVNRIDAASALTTGINAEIPADEDGTPYFDVPSTVTFAAGQNDAELVISFDPSVLGYDNKQTVTLEISDKTVTTPYGSEKMSFTVYVPAPWKSIGKGTVVENWWPMGTASVEFMQNEVNPSQFKLVTPFGGKESPVITVLKPGDVLEGVTVTMEDLVYYEDIFLTYYSSYSDDLYICHPSGFKSGKTEDTWTHSHVVEYQENGMPAVIQLAGFYYMFNTGGWNNSADDGDFLIYFPGCDPKDFSFVLNREGTFYDLEENPYAVASITFGTEETEKSDIAYIKAACVLASNEDAALEALLSGKVESVELESDGSVNLPMSGESGKYFIIAVAYDSDGEPQEYMSKSFEYYAPGSTNPWESIGWCKYTDDIVAPMWDAPVVSYYVEVLQNTEAPGMYRIVHPYGADYPYNDPGDYDETVHYFEIDATDPAKVWFDEIDLGFAWDSGEMYAMSYYAYVLATGGSEEDAAPYAGKLEDGKITFPVKGILYADDDGAYLSNASGAFCLDLSNPLAERPEEGTEAASASRVSKRNAVTVKKLRSRAICSNLSKAGLEMISR